MSSSESPVVEDMENVDKEIVSASNSSTSSSSASSATLSRSTSSLSSRSSWRASILHQLRKRNTRDINPFSDLISLHNRVVERTSSLQMESGQLSFINEKLKEENADLKSRLAGGGGSVAGSFAGDGANSERVSMLEKKLFSVQEELTELHRRRSENAQQIIDQTSILKENEKKLFAALEELKHVKAKLSASNEEVVFLQSALGELEATNQLLKDEYQTLQLALSSAEQKLVAAQKENDLLVAQILDMKERDVQRINEENERLRVRHNLMVQQQLEDAVNESKTVVVPRRTSRDSQPIGTENLESVMCYMARIPTRAYLNFEAHDGEVNAVKWSPHGLTMITGGSDRKVKVWDISKGTQELRGTLTGSNGAIMSLDFDSGGSLVLAASASDFTSRVWTLDDQRLRHTLTGHSGKVLSAKFMGDNNKVVSASYDRTIKIWDLRSKACVSTKFAGSSCNDIVCTDANIISGHFDKKIRFWDTRTSSTEPLSEINMSGKVTSLDLARNGQSLLACLRDDTLRLIDLRMNREVSVFNTESFHVGCDWTRAVFSPDSEYVCVGSLDGAVYIWSVNDPSRLETSLREHESSVVAVAWQPAGNSLSTCDKNKKVIVWADI